MNTLLIYRSKTGFTKQYAEWICETLPCDVVSWKAVDENALEKYDTIIYGSSLHAGMILGLKKFFQMVDQLDKKIIVFATGACPADSPDIATAMRKNFTDEQWARVKTFYFQSGLCYEKMGLVDKTMMAMFRSMLKKQKNVDNITYEMVQKSYDLSEKKFIEPLVAYCKAMQQ